MFLVESTIECNLLKVDSFVIKLIISKINPTFFSRRNQNDQCFDEMIWWNEKLIIGRDTGNVGTRGNCLIYQFIPSVENISVWLVIDDIGPFESIPNVNMMTVDQWQRERKISNLVPPPPPPPLFQQWADY